MTHTQLLALRSTLLRSMSALVLVAIPSAAQAQALHADEEFFRDSSGAVVILRGLNVSGDAKVPPFRPIDDSRLLDGFPAWGVNVARLLFTWEAFEPERGRYDEAYFAYYLDIIEALHARGVWVIVDVHQDGYSRFVMDGCGEGFPEWTVSPAVPRRTPDNGANCASWGIKLVFDTDMHRAWDDFYADVGGVRTRYLELLATLSSRLKSHPAVIGYDMINEPWADELTQLAPLHEAGANVLRAEDPDAILFLSPQALTSSGQDTKLPRATFANFAYAPHYYDAGLVTLQLWTGGSLKDPIERMLNQAVAWKVPLLIGEFGAPAAANGASAYVDAFYRELDAHFVSSTQWTFVAHYTTEFKDGWNMEDYSIVDERGAVRANYRIRPYPARISGEPVKFDVARDPEPIVTLAWTHQPALGATRIFAPRASFFLVDVAADSEGQLACAYEYDELHVRCTSDTPGAKSVQLRRCEPDDTCLKRRPPEPRPVSDAGTSEGTEGDASAGGASSGTSTGSEPEAPGSGTVRPRSKSGGCTLGEGKPRSSALAVLVLTLAAGWRARSRIRRATPVKNLTL